MEKKEQKEKALESRQKDMKEDEKNPHQKYPARKIGALCTTKCSGKQRSDKIHRRERQSDGQSAKAGIN